MGLPASYYRARIQAIETVSNNSTGHKEKSSPEELLRYGYIHEDIQGDILDYMEQAEVSNEPLTFTEICSYNTWFVINPHKIAGKEVLTSSREFPITIKGTKEDIIHTLSHSHNLIRTRIVSVQAQAKLKLLNLLQL